MRLALCGSMQLSRFRAFAACLSAFALAFAFFTPAYAAPDPDLDVKVQIVGEEIRAQVSLFVRAPQQRVWEVITDFERAPQYTRDLQVSRATSRAGANLRLFQQKRVSFGPLATPVGTL